MNPTVSHFFEDALQNGAWFLPYAALVAIRIFKQDQWNRTMDWEWVPLARIGFYRWRLSLAMKALSKSKAFLVFMLIVAGAFLLLMLLNCMAGAYFYLKLPKS
jgi:hypothetical protein